jgi:DnaK suppressor protein
LVQEEVGMNVEFKKQMKQKLFEMKEQILKQLVSESDEFQEIVDDMEPKDLADIAADDIDRRILEVLGSQEIKRLQLIDSALGRIENGHYGICMSCGKKIPHERLQAIPYAILCIDCKSSEERRNR